MSLTGTIRVLVVDDSAMPRHASYSGLSNASG